MRSRSCREWKTGKQGAVEKPGGNRRRHVPLGASGALEAVDEVEMVERLEKDVLRDKGGPDGLQGMVARLL